MPRRPRTTKGGTKTPKAGVSITLTETREGGLIVWTRGQVSRMHPSCGHACKWRADRCCNCLGGVDGKYCTACRRRKKAEARPGERSSETRRPEGRLRARVGGFASRDLTIYHGQ
jgi:hypothetical protein